MKRFLPLAALAAVSLVAACGHHGSRSFSISNPAPPPENPPPHEPPPPPPGPTANNDGAITRTTDGVTNVAGGVLHVAGNVVLGVGDHVGGVGQVVDHVGDALSRNGLGGVPVVGAPVSNLVDGVDGKLNGVAQVQVVSAPVLGATTPSGNQAIGASALSQTPSTGSVVTVGVLNQGSQQQIANVSLGGTQVLGTPGPAAVNVGLLNGAAPPVGSNPLGSTGSAVSNATSGVIVPIDTIFGKH